MIYKRLHVTFVGIVATLVDSVVVAEFAGYWLQRILHSDKFPSSWHGYKAAMEYHGLEQTELLSLRNCSQALFRKDPGCKMVSRMT